MGFYSLNPLSPGGWTELLDEAGLPHRLRRLNEPIVVGTRTRATDFRCLPMLAALAYLLSEPPDGASASMRAWGLAARVVEQAIAGGGDVPDLSRFAAAFPLAAHAVGVVDDDRRGRRADLDGAARGGDPVRRRQHAGAGRGGARPQAPDLAGRAPGRARPVPAAAVAACGRPRAGRGGAGGAAARHARPHAHAGAARARQRRLAAAGGAGRPARFCGGRRISTRRWAGWPRASWNSTWRPFQNCGWPRRRSSFRASSWCSRARSPIRSTSPSRTPSCAWWTGRCRSPALSSSTCPHRSAASRSAAKSSVSWPARPSLWCGWVGSGGRSRASRCCGPSRWPRWRCTGRACRR